MTVRKDYFRWEKTKVQHQVDHQGTSRKINFMKYSFFIRTSRNHKDQIREQNLLFRKSREWRASENFRNCKWVSSFHWCWVVFSKLISKSILLPKPYVSLRIYSHNTMKSLRAQFLKKAKTKAKPIGIKIYQRFRVEISEGKNELANYSISWVHSLSVSYMCPPMVNRFS